MIQSYCNTGQARKKQLGCSTTRWSREVRWSWDFLFRAHTPQRALQERAFFRCVMIAHSRFDDGCFFLSFLYFCVSVCGTFDRVWFSVILELIKSIAPQKILPIHTEEGVFFFFQQELNETLLGLSTKSYTMLGLLVWIVYTKKFCFFSIILYRHIV